MDRVVKPHVVNWAKKECVVWSMLCPECYSVSCTICGNSNDAQHHTKGQEACTGAQHTLCSEHVMCQVSCCMTSHTSFCGYRSACSDQLVGCDFEGSMCFMNSNDAQHDSKYFDACTSAQHSLSNHVWCQIEGLEVSVVGRWPPNLKHVCDVLNMLGYLLPYNPHLPCNVQFGGSRGLRFGCAILLESSTDWCPTMCCCYTHTRHEFSGEQFIFCMISHILFSDHHAGCNEQSCVCHIDACTAATGLVQGRTSVRHRGNLWQPRPWNTPQAATCRRHPLHRRLMRRLPARRRNTIQIEGLGQTLQSLGKTAVPIPPQKAIVACNDCSSDRSLDCAAPRCTYVEGIIGSGVVGVFRLTCVCSSARSRINGEETHASCVVVALCNDMIGVVLVFDSVFVVCPMSCL